MDPPKNPNATRLSDDPTHPDYYKRHILRFGDTTNNDFEDINRAFYNAIPKGSELIRFKKILTDLHSRNLHTPKDLERAFMKVRRIYKGPGFRKSQLLHVYYDMVEKNELPSSQLGQLLIKKKGKSNSGVLVITVLTSPYPKYTNPKTGTIKQQKFTCKWNCYYCPNEPGQPRSYLHDEPSVLRANRNHFDPILQFHDRAMTLLMNGHPVDKIELLVLGGTWSSYPHEYQEEFIRDIFYAANTFFERKRNDPNLRSAKSLTEEKKSMKLLKLRL